MQIAEEYNYRSAKEILNSVAQDTLQEIYSILSNPENQLDFNLNGKKQRNLSKQVQQWFKDCGWEHEVPSIAVPEMRYDLTTGNTVVEIELGHQRLVFPDFFEFLADYSHANIHAGIMIVTGNPRLFGHDWHCSIESTKRKIESIREFFLVPLLIIAVNP